MDSDARRNRYFSPPPDSALADESVRGFVRAEFLDAGARFLDRLACARVFDRERFEALLLWLDALHRSYIAENLEMPTEELAVLRSIESYLAVEVEHSRDQQQECVEAHGQLLAVMRRYGLLT